jgi:hypothetical protein
MTSPNRLKIHKLFDDAHSKSDLVKVSHSFATVFAAMKWEWLSSFDGNMYVPNHSHIFQTIKGLLIDLKIMIDETLGPIRQTDDFSMSTGRIKCRIFYMDNEWHLTVDLMYYGFEFVA